MSKAIISNPKCLNQIKLYGNKISDKIFINDMYILRILDPLESLTTLNMCISDIQVWMIKNKLKINDSKTKFIIFRSSILKQNSSDL